MLKQLTTERLLIQEMSMEDAAFIFELVNTPDWIKFIGDRNVATLTDAEAFVARIIANPNINYWVVKTKVNLVSVGIISFVKRNYLDYYDVGFAFLPNHTQQGYAYEASTGFLRHVAKDYEFPQILATVIKENFKSISLLSKLGFQFEKQIEVAEARLQVFSVDVAKLAVARTAD